MKKKRRTIILIIVAILVVLGLFMFRMIWVGIHGQEELSGSQEAIPGRTEALTPITKGESDWPYWRGPTGNNRSSVTGIRKDWSGGLQKLWEVSFLDQGKDAVTWAAPAIQGNRLVVPGRGENSDLIFCLNPESGELIWSGSYEAKSKASHGSGARATPFIDDDRVYTFGRSGVLACWRLKDGELIWRRNVEDDGGKEPTWGHSSSPLVHEDKVIVQAGGEAFAIAYDKITGDLAWKSAQGKAGYAAIALAEIGTSPKLLVFPGAGLSCLEPGDGNELWSVPWKTNYGVNATTPVMAGETVFITSGYNTGCEALKVTESEAKVIWRSKVMASHHSDPIIIDGFLYGYSGLSNQNKGYFKCVELETGAEKWSTGEMGWGTVIHVDGHLICMDIKGNLFLIKPDPNEFRKVTEFRGAMGEVKHTAWTIPIVANGRLYLRYMQRLVCYNILP